MKPSWSYIDDNGKLFVTCIECKKGCNGDRTCPDRQPDHNYLPSKKCHEGDLMEEYKLPEDFESMSLKDKFCCVVDGMTIVQIRRKFGLSRPLASRFKQTKQVRVNGEKMIAFIEELLRIRRHPKYGVITYKKD